MKVKIHPIAKKALIVIGAIIILLIAVLAILPSLHKSDPVPADNTAPDAQAAVDAVMAFYTLDYTIDPDLWAARVCAHATDIGCRAIHNFFAPTIEVLVLENHVQTTCTVIPVQLVSDQGNVRIWQVTVTINNPWLGLENPVQDALVEVEDVNGTWLMNRILFQQEVDNHLTPVP